MITHNYCYNFSFFADFFAANPGIKKYDVLREMGMKDYSTLQRWMDGVTLMPLHQLMKFCNLYSVPITAMFLDENAEASSLVPAVPDGARIEPVGGWKDIKKGAGIKIGPSRVDVHYCSNLPAYCKTDADITAMTAGGTGPAVSSPTVSPVQTVASSPTAPQKQTVVSSPTPPPEPRERGLAHAERMRYLDIIEKLSSQVAQLSQALATSEKKQIINRHEHYTMVGEGDVDATDCNTGGH